MVICSTGPPLTALVALVFGLLLAFASQSQPTAREPHPPPRRSSPPSPSPPRPPWRSSPPSRRNRRLPLPLPPSTLINNSAPPPTRKPIQGLLPPAPLLTAMTKRKTHNLGKKVGISFAGIAVIVQFAVAGFLAYKKKQLYRVRD